MSKSVPIFAAAKRVHIFTYTIFEALKKIVDGSSGRFESGKLFRMPDTKMTHVFVGLQIINPKILDRAKKDGIGKCFSMSHFYKSAVGEGGLLHRIGGVELKGKYFHIGTVDAVKMTEENL